MQHDMRRRLQVGYVVTKTAHVKFELVDAPGEIQIQRYDIGIRLWLEDVSAIPRTYHESWAKGNNGPRENTGSDDDAQYRLGMQYIRRSNENTRSPRP